MTTTVKEELAKVASFCEEALAEQSRFEEFLANDFDTIDGLVKRFEGSQGNVAVTVDEARTITLQLRQAIGWNQVNAKGTRILMLLMLQVSILAQQDAGMKLEVPADVEKALGEWFEQWEAAKKAWRQYTE